MAAAPTLRPLSALRASRPAEARLRHSRRRMAARPAAGLGGASLGSGPNGSRRPAQPRARPQAVGRSSLRIAGLEPAALDDRHAPVLAGPLAIIRSRPRGPRWEECRARIE